MIFMNFFFLNKNNRAVWVLCSVLKEVKKIKIIGTIFKKNTKTKYHSIKSYFRLIEKHVFPFKNENIKFERMR